MDGSIDNKELIDKLANLLNETAEAQHKAFAATEGRSQVRTGPGSMQYSL